jgi:hypothetical protein
MAKIVGGINVTHVPYIGRAIANNLQQDAYWKPFFDGFPPVRDWLAKVKPDVAVLIYNDHGLQLLPRQDADLRRRRRGAVPQRGRRLGHPDAAALQG